MSDELKLYVREGTQSRESFEVMHELVVSLAREAAKYSWLTPGTTSKPSSASSRRSFKTMA